MVEDDVNPVPERVTVMLGDPAVTEAGEVDKRCGTPTIGAVPTPERPIRSGELALLLATESRAMWAPAVDGVKVA
jgi:hypothetical protein